jgi:hypothetical protein
MTISWARGLLGEKRERARTVKTRFRTTDFDPNSARRSRQGNWGASRSVALFESATGPRVGQSGDFSDSMNSANALYQRPVIIGLSAGAGPGPPERYACIRTHGGPAVSRDLQHIRRESNFYGTLVLNAAPGSRRRARPEWAEARRMLFAEVFQAIRVKLLSADVRRHVSDRDENAQALAGSGLDDGKSLIFKTAALNMSKPADTRTNQSPFSV